ncbi:putative dehydrogenase [Opitutaceae bacterium TAV1]|nr:putative dehydrogenase [Opitutaceae bacterium TAV1]
MKKKIGFIDYYIDEWHANNYPAFIRDSRFSDRYEVAFAWEAISPLGKKPLADWCREQGVRPARNVEQVVETCDYLIVLSPDNPEQHEALADLPLRSGKPVYIDKPFAPSLEAAARLFAKAEAHGTPVMSCSALRFGSALEQTLAQEVGDATVHFAATRGGGIFPVYAIHQLEMLVMTLGVGARRVMHCGNLRSDLMLIDYADGRRGAVNLMDGHPFQMSLRYGQDKSAVISQMDDFFPRFIDGMLTFFDTGESLVPKEETLEIAALIEVGNQALAHLDQWMPVPSR